MNFTPFNPIRALFWSAVINGVVAVPVMVLMMLLTANTKVMALGFCRFSRVSNWLFISRLFRKGVFRLEFLCRNGHFIGTLPRLIGSMSRQHRTADLFERNFDMAQIQQRPIVPPSPVVTPTYWRSSLIACLMLAMSAIVFEVNGHTPGAVNLRSRDLLPAVSLMDGRPFR